MDCQPLICRVNDSMSYGDMLKCFPSDDVVNNRFVVIYDTVSATHPKSFYFITDFSAN